VTDLLVSSMIVSIYFLVTVKMTVVRREDILETAFAFSDKIL
jgi:hypothetical protein